MGWSDGTWEGQRVGESCGVMGGKEETGRGGRAWAEGGFSEGGKETHGEDSTERSRYRYLFLRAIFSSKFKPFC